MPNFCAGSEVWRGPIFFGVVAENHNLRHTLCFERSGEFRDFHSSINGLAASHGHGRVVKNLEGDVGFGRNCLSNRQRSRVVERTIADVLKAMFQGDKWSCTHPLHSFTTHLCGAFNVSCGSH